MITFRLNGCALDGTVNNGINELITVPLNPGEIQSQDVKGYIDINRAITSRVIPSINMRFHTSFSLNVAEDNQIILINKNEEIPLTAGMYNMAQINETIQTLGLKPLLSLLDQIDFVANKVNVKNLEKILQNKDKLVKLIQEGRIEASNEQISKLTSLENNTYSNMHKFFLVWNKPQEANSEENHPSDYNLTSVLPLEVINQIFSYIPLTGEESIQAHIRAAAEENNNIEQVESGLILTEDCTITGNINFGTDHNA